MKGTPGPSTGDRISRKRPAMTTTTIAKAYRASCEKLGVSKLGMKITFRL